MPTGAVTVALALLIGFLVYLGVLMVLQGISVAPRPIIQQLLAYGAGFLSGIAWVEWRHRTE